jgi:hypothetical protein
MDLLTTIFERQLKLQVSSYGGDPNDLPIEDKIQYIRVMTLAAINELNEAVDETSWKTWVTDNYINRDAYVGELVDVLHFLVNLCLAVGVTPAELEALYQAKADKNKARMESGYDGVSTKCPLCKRALDDEAVRCGPIKFTDEFYCQEFHIDYRPVASA